eukprot:5288598-Karenia_brevis.AAC.1
MATFARGVGSDPNTLLLSLFSKTRSGSFLDRIPVACLKVVARFKILSSLQFLLPWVRASPAKAM